ncbi:MAG TPA: signal peptidase II [Gemmatimonadaceae bacterium]
MPSLRSFSPHHARNQLAAPLSDSGTFLGMTAVVLLGDLVSKSMAVEMWSGQRYDLLGRLVRIDVVHNQLGAFSTSLGTWTWPVNVTLTALALLLTFAACPRLARLDAIAPAALGLIAGGALGNLTSLVTSPGGVPDFLAIAHGYDGALVLNVADVAAYLGLACCARLAWSIGRALLASAAGHH